VRLLADFCQRRLCGMWKEKKSACWHRL